MAGARRRAALAGARKSAGHTQESLAAALHVDRSTVIRWEAGDQAPLPYLRPKLARLLDQSTDQLKELIENDSDIRPDDFDARPDIEAAFDWLDRHTGWSPGTSRGKVTASLGTVDKRAPSRSARSARKGRSKRCSRGVVGLLRRFSYPRCWRLPCVRRRPRCPDQYRHSLRMAGFGMSADT